MARPYDLLAFLNQDTRWDNMFNLHNDLLKQQIVVDNLWTELEQTIDFNNLQNSNEYCIKIDNLSTLDWYISFPEDGKSKGINDEEFMLYSSNFGGTDVPDCKKISSLTFSMLAFEHLEVSVHFIKAFIFRLILSLRFFFYFCLTHDLLTCLCSYVLNIFDFVVISYLAVYFISLFLEWKKVFFLLVKSRHKLNI